jgi:hypothetical protein
MDSDILPTQCLQIFSAILACAIFAVVLWVLRRRPSESNTLATLPGPPSPSWIYGMHSWCNSWQNPHSCCYPTREHASTTVRRKLRRLRVSVVETIWTYVSRQGLFRSGKSVLRSPEPQSYCLVGRPPGCFRPIGFETHSQ